MAKKEHILLFPHQLFKDSPILDIDAEIYLIEEYLFFKHYKFHKQKIAFHRASMKAYADFLNSKDKTVHYIESNLKESDIRKLIPKLIDEGSETLHVIDPTDNCLKNGLHQHQIILTLNGTIAHYLLILKKN
jgi:deoxyribodipyrimidine photolyase-related protein